MRRKLFFWLEKLKITPAERTAVVSLIAILTVISLLNLFIESGTAANFERYDAIRREFEKRTTLMKQEEARLMARYYPQKQPEKTEIVGTGMAMDTVTSTAAVDTTDTASTPQEVPTAQKININEATANQLEQLPGIGPVYAGRIVTYRQTNGNFATIDELIKIKGIGEKRLEDIRPFVEL